MARVSRFLDGGQLEQVEQFCREVIETEGENINMLGILGAILLKQRKINEAEKTLKRILMIIGSTVDLGTLWLLQRQPGPQWEFVALSRTVESVPNFAMGVAFLFLTLHLFQAKSRRLYSMAAVVFISLGVASAGLVTLMGLNYLTLVPNINPEALPTFKSSSLKVLALGGLYVVVLLPAGVFGLRSPGRRG